MAGAPGTSRERVEAALAALGITADIVDFAQGTRTSADAAAAIGCAVAQIAKSIVFRGAESGRAVVVIASGANRVDERKVAAVIGEPTAKADAAFVREATGFAIGGVAPLGFVGEVALVLDQDLLKLHPIWAAAGTPSSVFRVEAADLARLPGARLADIRQESA
jgi:prolyl-tRNA editing enzyme YbaK/EbsC (Cys-tRNA(Pro) deacylase)